VNAQPDQVMLRVLLVEIIRPQEVANLALFPASDAVKKA
jgi:hypothetical protein